MLSALSSIITKMYVLHVFKFSAETIKTSVLWVIVKSKIFAVLFSTILIYYCKVRTEVFANKVLLNKNERLHLSKTRLTTQNYS